MVSFNTVFRAVCIIAVIYYMIEQNYAAMLWAGMTFITSLTIEEED